MTRNNLKSYVRRTILAAAKEYAYPKARRTPESTRSALMDATRGTDTGWWTDLIYIAPMLAMAHKYRRDIAAALAEYSDATGEEYAFHPYGGETVTAFQIMAALGLCWPRHGGPSDVEVERILLGLRFAVEWYAGEVARELCPDF